MVHCKECEYYQAGPDGMPVLLCNPFANIKEPECLTKWQLLKLNRIAKAHDETVAMYARLAPLQEKMMRHIEREIDDADDADEWKRAEDEDNEGEGFGPI